MALKGNYLYRYLADQPEPKEPEPEQKPTQREPYTCPVTNNEVKCKDIPRSERCDNCLLRTR